MVRGLPIAGLVIFGCASAPHVRLGAPARDASETQRLAAYERLRPQPRTGYLDETFDDLRLGDGSRISHAEDILAVVPPRSRAAQAARHSSSLRGTSTILLVSGTALIVGGATWLGVGLAGDAGPFLDSIQFGLGVATLGLGVVVAALSAIPELQAADEESIAYLHYDRALRRRLDLCIADFHMVACR
jgi:hypothetical protein